MELIRQQAERAAKGEAYGVRELPPAVISVVEDARAKAAVAARALAAATPGVAVAQADGGSEAEQAARLARRQEALARKRAQLAGKG
jgi:hypothetical protein